MSKSWRTATIYFLLACLCIALASALDERPGLLPAESPAVPAAQLVVPGRVSGVYDGDTVTVEVTLRTRVRLLDCWAPELRNPGGKASRDHLREFAQGKACKLQVDLSKVDRLDDVLSFGRVLGVVWVDGSNLSKYQVDSGHATRTR